MAIGAGQQWALAMLIVIGLVSRFLIPTLLDNGPCCITTTYSAVVKRQKYQDDYYYVLDRYYSGLKLSTAAATLVLLRSLQHNFDLVPI